MTPLELLDAIRDLREQASAQEAARAPAIDALPISWRRSAANLAHYLALRSTGHVALQGELVRNGLSSLAPETRAGLGHRLRAGSLIM